MGNLLDYLGSNQNVTFTDRIRIKASFDLVSLENTFTVEVPGFDFQNINGFLYLIFIPF